MRKETDLLEHIPGLPPKRDRVYAGDVALPDHDPPPVGGEHPVDQFERGALAGAAAADEREGFPSGISKLTSRRTSRSPRRHQTWSKVIIGFRT
jgi:hypothetical protein